MAHAYAALGGPFQRLCGDVGGNQLLDARR